MRNKGNIKKFYDIIIYIDHLRYYKKCRNIYSTIVGIEKKILRYHEKVDKNFVKCKIEKLLRSKYNR